MTVLVTGGAGFIGSHLVDYLLEETDDNVRILDNYSTGQSENLSHIDSPRLEIHEGNARDADVVREAASGVDKIYHLAAAVGVRQVVDSPLESLKTNLHSTENVLNAAREEDAAVFLASSSEVYGKSEAVPFSEGDDSVIGPTTIPRWGYAMGKATDEFMALSYHNRYDLPVAIGRYFNVVGPRQTSEYGAVIPTFVEQALAGEPITVYGDGTQTRSFTPVSVAVTATHQILETPAANGEVVNIGTDNVVTINELAELVLDVTGSQSPISHIPFEEAYGEDFEEPSLRRPNIDKLSSLLNRRPNSDLRGVIEQIVSQQPSE